MAPREWSSQCSGQYDAGMDLRTGSYGAGVDEGVRCGSEGKFACAEDSGELRVNVVRHTDDKKQRRWRASLKGEPTSC